MNYQKGQLRPTLVSLKLDPEDTRMIDDLLRARRQRTYQAGILAILREYSQFRTLTQEERVENIEWKRLYFDLAETTSALRHTAEALLQQIDDADEKAKKDSRRRLSLA